MSRKIKWVIFLFFLLALAGGFFSTRNSLVSEKTYSIVFVGDVMLDRGVKNVINREGDARFPFLKTRDMLSGADLSFANLEGPISKRGKNSGSIYSFRFNPEIALPALQYAGLDVVSIANNHIFDYGAEALEDTEKNLSSVGIKSVGAGNNYLEANSKVISRLDDGTKIAWLAYTNLYPRSLMAGKDYQGVSDFDLENIKKQIAAARGDEADLVFVSYHWGEEYKTSANGNQKELAHAIIDAGANLVIGHHPHVVQEVENYKDGYIAYSLGNFVFDQVFSEGTRNSVALRALVKEGRILGLEMAKIRINDSFQPEIVE